MCTSYVSDKIRNILFKLDGLNDVNEIRLRRGMPLYVKIKNKEVFINDDGECVLDKAYLPTSEDIKNTLSLISSYSLYAFNDEIKKGYITLKSGFRVGLAGQAVYSDGKIVTLKNISSLNFRIAREVKGCGDYVASRLLNNGLKNIFIISPPGCGKTTLLRDLIRIISNSGSVVGVADERGEIAGTYMGNIQTDLGIRTDVIDGCRKNDGMNMLLRSMAPDVIAADEIGSDEDKLAIEEIIKCGVKIICTAHGKSIEDISGRKILRQMIDEKIFDYYVFLSGIGQTEKILNKELILI
jgi:stage III sporulation protein AA